MNITSILLGLAAILDIVVGILVYFKNRFRMANIYFMIFCLNLALWCISVILIIYSKTVKAADLNIRIAFLIGAFLPPNFYAFQKSLGGFNPSLSRREKNEIRCLYLIALIFSFMIFSKKFLKEVILIKLGEEPFHSLPEAKYGFLFILYVIYCLLIMSYGLIQLRKKKDKSPGIFRTEIQYVFLGILLGTIIVTFTNLLAPYIWKTTLLSQFAPFSSTVMIFIIGYAIARYKIMSFSAVIERTKFYFILSSLLSFIYFICWLSFLSAFRFIFPDAQIISMVIAGFIAILLFVPLASYLEEKIVGLKEEELREMEEKVFYALSGISSFNELNEKLSSLIQKFFGVKNVKVFIKDENYFYNIMDKNEIIHFTNPVVQTLKRKGDILWRDELERRQTYPLEMQLLKEIRRYNLYFMAPIFFKNELVAIWGCGEKYMKEPYYAKEIDLVASISRYLASALENLELYNNLSKTKIFQETLLENLADGIIGLNEEGEIVIFNREAERLVGLSKKDVIGRKWNILPYPFNNCLEKIQKEKVFYPVDPVKYQKNGNEIFLRIRGSSFLRDEEIKGYLLIFSDITHIKQLEEEVRRAEKLASIGVMAAGIAHEIKNPLVSIKTFAQLLPEKFMDKDFRDSFTSVAIREIDRINNLIEQLLTFARRRPTNFQKVNLIDVLKSTLLIFLPQIENKKIDVEEDYSSPSISIKADPEKLKQAFLNILINSKEAIEKEGKIVISVREEEDKVKMWIKDNGKGMKKEIINKIFDPFFTTKPKGTGLGLSIVAGIINDHKGRISVESEENKGTTVYIELPKGE
ncbi:MAG: hypothetical protein DRP67_02145 [Candidatus Omnitrophota bacterium]|nr:MAG: hypothetical protein DRP67_02145 [Candidatus Omnitrophota bacterium]